MPKTFYNIVCECGHRAEAHSSNGCLFYNATGGLCTCCESQHSVIVKMVARTVMAALGIEQPEDISVTNTDPDSVAATLRNQRDTWMRLYNDMVQAYDELAKDNKLRLHEIELLKLQIVDMQNKERKENKG